MIVTCGVIKVNGLHNVERAIDELKKKDIKVNDIDEDKIVFLMEAETIDVARSEIEHLRDIEYVRDVNLLYYSFEDDSPL